MVSCLGKKHNLPRTIKTKSQRAGCDFSLFPFRSSSSIPPWPLRLLRGSVGHTVTPTVFFFSLIFNHSGKLLYLIFDSFGFKLLNYK